MRYKDYLTGQNTPTSFDNIDTSQMTKPEVRALGTEVREYLVAQLPATLSSGHTPLEQLVFMAQSQIDQILQLKGLVAGGHIEQRPTQQLEINPSQAMGLQEDDSEGAVTKEEGGKKGVAIKIEDDSDERGAMDEGDDDDDDNHDLIMEREEGSESSYDPEDHPVPSQISGAPQVPDDVNDALEAVKSHVARAANADWSHPHAALVWAQVIAEDLTTAAVQLRAALDSKRA